MGYVVLARKYRPRSFSEVVGQDEVKQTLQGALRGERVGHAYLFAGPRGTGKTTTARILAKALNCEQGPALDPCNECARCKAADSGAEADLVEIDGASNNGVEHVRALRDQAAYAPMEARFKIYLVDEVHMLSKSAFNALLKTLEEPPAHVKFLFATTEPNRVLNTILSRCQVLKLTPLAEDLIAARLDEIFGLEGIQAEPGVTREIARRARGGMRDALSLADQVLARTSTPGLGDVSALDDGGSRMAHAVLQSAAMGDKAGALGALPADEGRETDLVADLLDHLRVAVLAGLLGPNAPQVMAHASDAEQRTALVDLARAIGQARAELWLTDLLNARERMRLLPGHARVILETALLEMASDDGDLSLADLAARLEALESGAPLPPRVPSAPAPRPSPPQGGGAGATPPAAPSLPQGEAPRSRAPEVRSAPVPPATSRPQGSAPAEAPPTASPGSVSPAAPQEAPAPSVQPRTRSVGDRWNAFLETVRKQSPTLGEVLDKRASLLALHEDSMSVSLRGMLDFERTQVLSKRNHKRLEQILEGIEGHPVRIQFSDQDESAGQPPDPFTQRVAEQFNGRIDG